jgi:HDOD domain
MSVEFQGQFHRPIPGDSADGSKDPFGVSSGFLKRDARDVSDTALRLTRLLRSAPVDLARIGREIRAHPDLEALIMRLAASLGLSIGSTGLTIEEAAVVLGTDRLRVLVYMWSLLPDERGAAESRRTDESQLGDTVAALSILTSAFPAGNPETLYLAGFLRWLGLDLPDPATPRDEPPCFAAGLQSADLPGLTDILVRDLVALIPVLDPAFLKLPQTVVSEGHSDTREKETA